MEKGQFILVVGSEQERHDWGLEGVWHDGTFYLPITEREAVAALGRRLLLIAEGGRIVTASESRPDTR